MKFTHLHVHSHYSLLDGLAKIDQLLDKAAELGFDSLALTDHGSLYGAVEFYKKAKEKGIKPIIGSEVYLAPLGMLNKRPKIDDRRYHLILLAKNKEGYKNLVKLTTKAWLEGHYYKPRIDKELLKKHSGGLIGLSACLSGEIPRLIHARKIEEAQKAALEYREIFGENNFYLEIEHHPGLTAQEAVNQEIIKLAKKHKIGLVAAHDVHYLNPEDAQAQDILMAVQTKSQLDDEERLTMKGDNFSLQPGQQMEEWFKETPEAILNTQKIAQVCSFEFELDKIQLPYFEVPQGLTPNKYLEKLALQGIERRYKKTSSEIDNRLKYELSIIEKTGFASYFLIVQDFVNWAKKQGIVVGPGRGSAAGSIVSYLLNITDIDPLKYDLFFERFLNPERISMPDFDLDFADDRRDEVINYVREKYGQNNVAQIITFGTMAARAAIRDAGRAMAMPYSFCDQIAKMIPFNRPLEKALHESQELHQIYDSDPQAKKLIDTALKLEGVARHASTHACGVVISKEPLDNLIPLQHPTQDDQVIVTQYEMHSIEDLGLLKMDLLGLKNLTIIQRSLNLIKKIYQKEINLSLLPLDDKKTFKLLQEAKTTGIFQLECLSGETIVSNTTIKKLYERRDKKILESIFLDEGTVHKNQILDVVSAGKKDVNILITENNWYIKATPDHYFLSENGWKKLKNIKKGEKILIKERVKHLVYNFCRDCGEQINGQKEGKSKYCYKCSASFYKNPSKPESRKRISESRKRFYKNGGKPWNYRLTKETSIVLKNTGKKISKALLGRTFEDIYGIEKAEKLKKILSQRNKREGNPMFGKKSPHRRGGWREDLRHYVRSNWEADFARILKLYNLEYEYEHKTFELKDKNGEILHYTPDFYVKSKNTFYEVKGWLHELDDKKIKLFQEQHPQYNFVLVNTTKFAELALRYKHLIKWECPQIPIKFKFIKVKEVKYAGKEMTYDIIMKSPGNNFVANGFMVHNSGGMKRYLKDLKPTEFEDIIAMVSLYRPGPMELIPEFIGRKQGRKKIEYLHPKLELILKNTYGICLYQEQLMEVAKDLAGFSLAKADILRKAVGKKIRKLLEEQKEKLIQGMVKNNISSQTAQKIWQWIEPFAQYGFNRSHAACYALIGYETAFLKAHYPALFMNALLQSEEDDIERVAFLIEECKQMGIEILPPSINESNEHFTVAGKKTVFSGPSKIRFGLLAIKNVGSNVAQNIIKERETNGPFKTISDFIERVQAKDLNKKSLEALIKSGAFDELGERNQLLFNLELLLNYGRELQRNHQNGQVSLFGLNSQINLSELKLHPAPPASEKEKLTWEKELLGLYISSHPAKKYQDYFEKHGLPLSKINSQYQNQQLRIGGIITKIQKIITRGGQPMLFVTLEDLYSKIEVLVFPRVLERTATSWQEDKAVLVSGRLTAKDSNLKIICDDVRLLEE